MELRYYDDFVVMCGKESQAREALRRIGLVKDRLGWQLHPEKTRMVDLRRGKQGFVFLGCTIRKTRSTLRESMGTFHAPLAVTQGDESAARPRPGDHECEEQRGRREAAHCQAEPRASRLGELLPNGYVLAGVSEDGPIRVFAAHARAIPARRSTDDAAGHLDWRTVLGYGPVPPAWDRALPGASHTRKIIVKPCVGKPHARLERGLLTGWR